TSNTSIPGRRCSISRSSCAPSPRCSPAAAPPRQTAGGQLQGRCHHGGQRGGVGLGSAGQVEGRAVVYGGAQEGEAEGPVGGEAEGGGLDRDQALVVIEREHPVELAAPCPREERVGALRPAHVGAAFARPRDRRGQEAPVLFAQEAALAGVRV